MRHPAALVAVPLLAGAAAAGAWPGAPAGALAACLPVAWGVAWLACRRGLPRVFVAAIAAAACVAGAALAADAGRRATRPPLVAALEARPGVIGGPAPVRLEGRLRRDAEVVDDGARLALDVERAGGAGWTVEASGLVRLSVRGSLAPAYAGTWRAGRRVRLWALLRAPGVHRNPGDPASPPPPASALVGAVKSARLVDVVSAGSPADEAAARARAYVRRAVSRHAGRRSRRAAAIITAILIGDRGGLDDDVQQRLQEAGTYHVIAISGAHVALLAVLVLGALRAAGVAWRLSSIATVAVLSAYAYLVGGAPSIQRATIVVAVYLGARVLDHHAPPVNTLAVAAAGLLVARPLVVSDAGFVLSFGATLGILLGASRLVAAARARLGGGRAARVIVPLAGLGAATVCAEVALMPVLARVFSRVTFAGLVLNFFAVPLLSVAEVAGLATVALAPVSAWAADRAGDVAALAAEGLVRSAGLVRFAPWLSWRLPGPPLWLLALYYLGWGVWLAMPPRWRRARTAALALAALAFALVLAAPTGFGAPPPRGRLRVTFLDVGQGDATLVQFPGGRSLLVDAGGTVGGRFDVGGRIVAPALWRLGVRRLDYLLATHADPDHIGGAPSVVRDFRPRVVWEGVPVPRDPLRRALLEAASAVGSGWRRLQTGDRLTIGPVDVLVLHPPPPDWERQAVRNDDSVVLELRWGRVAIVLPGDVSRDVEGEVAAAAEPAPLLVLKTPHHGSASSSSWRLLDPLRPAAAIVSAGRGNPFGHPAPSVLARYRAVGAHILRTDDDGAVTLETDGETVQLRTFTGRTITLRTEAHGR